MQYYTEFLGMTPEQLLLEAEADILNGVLPRLSKIKRHLIDYKEHLHKQNLAPLTIKSRMTGVYSFYKMNDITLPSLPRNESRPRPLKQHKDIPTKEDLQVVLSHADDIERAIVLIGVSGGLGAQEICNLTISDFKKGYDPETGVTTLKLRREKAEYDFVTFLSPEASNAVLTYLDSRNRQPKQYSHAREQQLKKQRIYSDDGYLLIKRRVSKDFLKSMDESLRQLSTEDIGDIYQGLSLKSGKVAPCGTFSLIRSHNMRKYFNSTLLNNGADSFLVDFWMGHTLDETRSAYFRASGENGLRETYMKHMSYLTISEAYDPTKDPNFTKLKQENSALTRVIENTAYETRTARNEMHDLKEQLEELKEFKKMFDSIEELDDERQRDIISTIKWMIEHRKEQTKY